VPKVLVIDDDEELRFLYRRVLEWGGHEVILGEDGLRGLAVAQRQRPDAIILDLMMPIMDGYDVLDLLTNDERTRHIPVIVLSAVSLTDARARCERSGAALFISKPFEPDALMGAIDELVGSSGAATSGGGPVG
jgi:CheY-like chemotaxis protein